MGVGLAGYNEGDKICHRINCTIVSWCEKWHFEVWWQHFSPHVYRIRMVETEHPLATLRQLNIKRRRTYKELYEEESVIGQPV